PAPGARLLAAARAAVPARSEPGPLRGHLRLPRPRPLAAGQAGAAGAALSDLTARHVRVLALSGLATFFVGFDSTVLVLALPSIAAEFGSSYQALTGLGSALQLGTLAGLPLAMLADRLGRRRLLAVGVAGFSLANLASAAAPSLAWLAGARVLAVAFESVAAAVATALVIEEVPSHQRARAVAAITNAGG